ncbi:MAG: hypothetical protein N2595_00025, partial [bacterium]|nr:hypothetical protein [bacterium]
PGGALQLRVGANPVLTDLAIRLGPHILIPQPLSHGQWLAELTRGSSIVARATLKQRSNNRGDVILNLLTEILAPGLSSDDIPCLTTLIPAPLLSNSLVVARRHGTYLHTPAFSLADPSVNALFSGPSLDEWSLVLPNDWFVWQLDAASLAASCVTNGLLLHITSRSPWQPPLTPGRAHALQFRLHLPVGIIP